MAEKIGDFYGVVGMRVDQGSFAKAGDMIGKIKAGVAAFLAFEAVNKIKEGFLAVVETGGHINDIAQKTGVAAETLQAYGYAAGLAGSNLDEVSSSLGKLSKGLVEATTKGTGNAADGFKMLGISLNDPVVKAMDLDGILLKVADKFHGMPDGPKKTAAAMELFGKSGANLIPTLNEGAEGLGKLKKEAKELGVVMSEDEIKNLDDLGDNLDRLKAGSQGLKNAIVTAIAPLINDLMPDKIASKKAMVAWVKEHRVEIVAFVKTVGYTLATVAGGIKEFFRVLFIILKAVGTAIGQAIGWVVTKIKEIGKGFSQLWSDVAGFASDAATAIVNAFRDVQQFFADVVVGIRHIWEDVFTWVIAKVADFQKTMYDFIKTVSKIPGIGEPFKAAVNLIEGSGMAPQGGDAIRERARIERENETRAKQQLPPLPFTSPDAGTTAPTTSPTAMTGAKVEVGGVNITVTPGPGMNEKELAIKVGEVVDEKMSAVFRHAQTDEGLA